MVNGQDNSKVLSCERVWQEISNYLEGDVDSALRTAMDEHFRVCQRCQSVLQGARNVIRLYSDERMVDECTIEVPTGYSRRLERRLAQAARPYGSRWSTWSAWLVPAAALVLFAGGFRLASSLTVRRAMQSQMAQLGNGIPSDMPVLVTGDAKVFHVAGCPFIHNKDKIRTLTAGEAMREGYVPCLRCMRKYLQTASAGKVFLDDEQDVDVDAKHDDNEGGQ